MNDILKLISGIIGIIVISFSVFFFNETRYASTSSYVTLEQRVSLNELEDLLKAALDNMYFYRKLLRQDTTNEELQKKVQEAEEEVKNLKDHIKEIKKKS